MDRNRIFSTALALQGARTSRMELQGMGNSPEGQELAKALAQGVADGITAEEMVAEVSKAMCGDDAMVLELLQGVELVAKGHVEAHEREVGGKRVSVRAYETARDKAMKASTTAASSTLMAYRQKTPEGHENAASAHEEAHKAHAEAHEAHPTDQEENGVTHAQAREIHAQAAAGHRQTADDLRMGENYQRTANKAQGLSNLASQVGTSAMAQNRHLSAAAAHREAHGVNPNMGHMERAQAHEAAAKASAAFDESLHSDINHKSKWDATDASGKAFQATLRAHQSKQPEDHMKAAEAHGKAAEQHMAIHGAHESSEDAHHGRIARKHLDLNSYHSQVAKPGGAAEFAKASVELSGQTGDEAMKVEGRPDDNPCKAVADKEHEAMEEVERKAKEQGGPDNPGKGPVQVDDKEIGKAHVEQHTREVGGKVVQVASYDTHKQAAMQASHTAHQATAAAQTPEQHTSAAAGHMKAAVAHREAGKYSPESWMEKGHEDQAKLHEAYAQAHHAKAKAAGNRADTGVDQPPHTAQDVKNLEQHPDYQGFGYLGHSNRTGVTDEQVAEAANKAGLKPHELAAHLLSKSGRHMMDSHGGDTPHAQAVANFHKWMTDPKKKKDYDIESYSKELEGANPREQGDESRQTVVPKKGGASGAAVKPPKPAAKPTAEPEDKLPSYDEVAAKYKDHQHGIWNGGEMRNGQKYQTFEARDKNGEKVASHTIAHHPENMKKAEFHNQEQSNADDVAARARARAEMKAKSGGRGNPAAAGAAAGKAEAVGRAVMESAEDKSAEANKDWGADHQGAYNAHNAAKMAHKSAVDEALALKLPDKAKHHSEMAFKHVDKMIEHEKAMEAAKPKKK